MLNKPVLLLGGGLDSVATLLYLKDREEFSALIVDYGQVSYEKEKESAEYWCGKYGIHLIYETDDYIKSVNTQPNILFGTSDSQFVLDARNMVFVLKALKHTNNVYLGLTEELVPPDTKLDFLVKLEYLLTCVFPTKGTISVRAPLMEISKTLGKSGASYMAYNIDSEFFAKTMTCWCPQNGVECGVCRHCKDKKDIMEKVLCNG